MGTQETDLARFIRLDTFDGIYEWLSWDFPCPVYFASFLYPNASQALYACQYGHDDFLLIPHTAEELQTFIEERKENPDWRTRRLKWAECIVRDKFRRNAVLQQKLKDTGERQLVWNNQKDTFWGTVDKEGQNHLGRILQLIRTDLIEEKELDAWIVLCNDIEAEASRRPTLRLTEKKEGEQDNIIELTGRAYYRLGKLPDNDIVSRNPSVSRRHALLILTKNCKVLLVDLKSKSGTFLNDTLLELDHEGVELKNNDCIRLGASSRQYTIQIDDSNIIASLYKERQKLSQDIAKLSDEIEDPNRMRNKLCDTIFIRGLHYKTTKDDLLDTFLGCGDIKQINLPQRRGMEPSRSSEPLRATNGIALVTFSNSLSAKSALEKDGRALLGRYMRISYAEDRSNQKSFSSHKGHRSRDVKHESRKKREPSPELTRHRRRQYHDRHEDKRASMQKRRRTRSRSYEESPH